MAFRFEELTVWWRAFKLANDINMLTERFPKKELYSLSSQIKRAADSVVLNIAEGSTGQTKPEFKRFLNIALRSAIEVVACLMMAKERVYIAMKRNTKSCMMNMKFCAERLPHYAIRSINNHEL